MNKPFDQRTLTFDQWIAQLEILCLDAGLGLPDADAFKESYDEGLTPEEAFEEDMSNG